MSGISKWIEQLEHYPGWREWQRRRVGRTMDFGDPPFKSSDGELSDFVFSKEVDAQHAVAYGYLCLQTTVNSLRDLEYYFRRYPFHGLPVGKHEHLLNVCEMYFSRFYEYRSRAKNLLNAVNKAATDRRVDVGGFVKSFDRLYDAEIRARNGIHHSTRFDDIQIDKVWLTQVIAQSDSGARGWDQEHRATYRAASREWARRVKRRATALEQTTEAIAVVILECCPFLAPPE